MTDYGTPGVYGSDASTVSSPPSATERVRDVVDSTTQEGGGVASTAVDQTKAVASTAADQSRMVAHDAKDRARRLTEDARSRLRRQVDDQAGRLGRNLGDVGQQLRTMAEKADDPGSPVTDLARQAADGIEGLASRLDGGGLDQVVDDVKRFARNRPGVFLIGALGAGFVVGRLVRAVDLGEVMKGTEGLADSSVDPAVPGWDNPQVEQQSSDAAYEGFATTPETPGYESTPATPVPTYSDLQATGYPSPPPTPPVEGDWGRT